MIPSRAFVRRSLCGGALLSLAALMACTQSHAPHVDATHQAEIMDAALVGGVAIPPAVRNNLGITFARAERRSVTQSRRLPGQFELLPEARLEYRAPLAGRVTLHVSEFGAVEPGDLLFSVDSPEWRRIQHETVEAEGEIVMAKAALAVARARRVEAAALLSQQQARVDNLATLNMRKAELEAEVSSLRQSLPRMDAEVGGEEAALEEAYEHYHSRLKVLASLSGMDELTLQTEQDGRSAWRALTVLEIRAQRPATVERVAIANGAWLNEGDLALTTLHTTGVRFRAKAPQMDIPLFRDGMPASVVPVGSLLPDPEHGMRGHITLGLTADESDRTLSVFMTPQTLAPWARAGVAGYLEVQVTEGGPERLAIPMQAVIRDGLEHVFFRRDPNDPNRAMRVVADLGQNDGRWVEVRSGLMDGDEVVLDGVYVLNLSGAAQQAPPGYHFHADGTLHRDH